jgi:hypothetical protein
LEGIFGIARDYESPKVLLRGVKLFCFNEMNLINRQRILARLSSGAKAHILHPVTSGPFEAQGEPFDSQGKLKPRPPKEPFMS